MTLNLGNLRGAARPLLCAFALLLCADGAAAAQKGHGHGDKHDLKRHQKVERRAIKQHQRGERDAFGNTRDRRAHWREEQRALRRHQQGERNQLRRSRWDGQRDRNGRLHYSAGRGYFRDRGRRPNVARRNR